MNIHHLLHCLLICSVLTYSLLLCSFPQSVLLCSITNNTFTYNSSQEKTMLEIINEIHPAKESIVMDGDCIEGQRKAFEDKLLTLTSLTNLWLSNLHLQKSNSLLFLESPNIHTSLLKLSINHTYFKENNDAFTRLIESIALMQHLSWLDLTHCELYPQLAFALKDFLQKSTSLTRLRLNNNKFEVDGLNIIAEGISYNTILTAIELANNDICITDISPVTFIEDFKKNSTLTMLNLNDNSKFGILKNNIVGCIADIIKNHPTITHIALSGIAMNSEQLMALASALTENTVLQRCTLFSNNVDEKTLKYFITAIADHPSLTSITLPSVNSLEDEVDKNLKEHIEKSYECNTIIRNLDTCFSYDHKFVKRNKKRHCTLSSLATASNKYH